MGETRILKDADPSHNQACPSLTRTETCPTQAGPSFYQADPFSNPAGPSYTQADTSNPQPNEFRLPQPQYNNTERERRWLEEEETMRLVEEELMRLEEEEAKMLEEEKAMEITEEELMRLEDEETLCLDDEEEAMRVQELSEEPSRVTKEMRSPRCSTWPSSDPPGTEICSPSMTQGSPSYRRTAPQVPARGAALKRKNYKPTKIEFSPLTKCLQTKPETPRDLEEIIPQNKIGVDYTRVGNSDFGANDYFASKDPAGPSHTQTGPCPAQTDPSLYQLESCFIQADSSLTQEDPPHCQAGPSHSQTVPSLDEAGPSHKQNIIESQTIKFKCPHCEGAYSTKSNLARHIRSVHGLSLDNSLRCKKCGRYFIKVDSLRRHIRAIHSDKEPGSEYPCSKCGITFKSASCRLRHIRNCPSLTEQPLEDTVDESSAVDMDADTHEVEFQTVAFKCKLCDKHFKSKYNLDRHMNTVHDEGRVIFKCDDCGKRFLRRDSLQVHIKAIHSNIKPDHHYTCSKCGCEYVREKNLVRHQKLGCNISPLLSCTQCDFKTHYKISLKHHMFSQHGSGH